MHARKDVRRRGTRWSIAVVIGLALLASGCSVAATWTPQSVSAALPPSPDRISLTDIACPASGACVAIGQRTSVVTEAIVLRQDGTTWQQLALPVPAAKLRGVSCRGVDDCLIGLDVADLHLGAGGLSVVPPYPEAEDALAATGPACVASGCLQVLGSASSWWNGTTWSTPVTVPGELERFDRVLTCASATSCVLVGNSFGIEGWPTPGNVESSVWNGTTWSTPVTVSGNGRVLDLACASPTNCFASSGVRADYWTGGLPLPAPQLLRWNGTSWATVSLTFPGASPTEPPSIACSSATSCTALWAGGEASPPSAAYLGRWNGTSWTVTSTTVAATATSLGCGSSTSCVAAGGPTAEQLSGTTWTATTVPTGSSPSEALGRVSCATADACMAIGTSRQIDAAGTEVNAVPITRRLNGSTWVTEPPDTHPTDGVACGSATSCMTAIGAFGSVTTRHWNGTSWQTLPTITNDGILRATGLSCPTATWCIVTTSNFGTGEANLSWTWSGGTTWTALPALPPGSGSSRGVSCSAPGECVALTNFIGPHLYRLSGSTWTEVSLSGLGLGSLGELEAVDCTGPGECAVVGRQGYDDDTTRPIGILAVLRNGTWTPALRPGTSYSDVDCWSSSGCVAIGGPDDPSTRPAVETWTGTAWKPVRPPSGASTLRGVSCGAPKTCEVTGGFVDGSSRSAVAKLTITG